MRFFISEQPSSGWIEELWKGKRLIKRSKSLQRREED
jgi:hypothetical protein